MLPKPKSGGIDVGFARKEPLRELLGGHFESEDGDTRVLADGRITSEIQTERALAHAGAGRDDDQIRAL